jgi:hypothetical protein
MSSLDDARSSREEDVGVEAADEQVTTYEQQPNAASFEKQAIVTSDRLPGVGASDQFHSRFGHVEQPISSGC